MKYLLALGFLFVSTVQLFGMDIDSATSECYDKWGEQVSEPALKMDLDCEAVKHHVSTYAYSKGYDACFVKVGGVYTINITFDYPCSVSKSTKKIVVEFSGELQVMDPESELEMDRITYQKESWDTVEFERENAFEVEDDDEYDEDDEDDEDEDNDDEDDEEDEDEDEDNDDEDEDDEEDEDEDEDNDDEDEDEDEDDDEDEDEFECGETYTVSYTMQEIDTMPLLLSPYPPVLVYVGVQGKTEEGEVVFCTTIDLRVEDPDNLA